MDPEADADADAGVEAVLLPPVSAAAACTREDMKIRLRDQHACIVPLVYNKRSFIMHMAPMAHEPWVFRL